MTVSKCLTWKAWLLFVPLALGVAGQAGAVPRMSQGIVFVADGAVGQGLVADGIAQAINSAGVPLNVQQFDWSTLNEPTDFQSQYNFTVKSRQLAGRILQYRAKHPTAKIYLVGFGAGTTVILKAAACLPPNTVTHIILLASSVSCGYDLRPALLSSCEGIDAFYCPNDVALRCAVKKFGPTDMGVRGVSTAAGLTCFHALSNQSKDQMIYSRLRQRRLPAMFERETRAGWLGGHIGYTKPTFLRACVVGLIEASMIGNVPHVTYPSPAPVPPPVPAPKAPPYPQPAPQYPQPAPKAPAPQYPPIPAPSLPAPAPQSPPYQPSTGPRTYPLPAQPAIYPQVPRN